MTEGLAEVIVAVIVLVLVLFGAPFAHAAVTGSPIPKRQRVEYVAMLAVAAIATAILLVI
ncbi:hypothetical protein [Cellulosimicrobium sp. Marseille-Q4280]|uniref:hypothetical protein n=1 Tax=Cellulosimicrobium sp. Marseille-Q4280 TaxID=2937992 RepID=UPI00203DAE27|nr:hypothetical protein [Cellulosimicrobium sp. Marseille-Q4280]